MELYEGLLTRRSIRKFQDREVPEETVMECLKAAMHAPSAKNGRDWEFIIITDPAKKEQVSLVTPYIRVAKDAPVVVIVCGNSQNSRVDGIWIQDCSAAMQNMLLAAHAKGLGSLWCGIHPYEDAVAKVKEVLNIPEGITPLGACLIGYPDRNPVQPNRFEEAKIHYNTF